MADIRTGLRHILTRGLAVTTLLCMKSGLASARPLGARRFGAATEVSAAMAVSADSTVAAFVAEDLALASVSATYPMATTVDTIPILRGDEGVCYVVRQRVMTRYGWRIRRVNVCE